MTSRQAAEFDFALERNNWTAEDVKKMSEGDMLAKLLLVVRGRAEVVVRSILIFLRSVKVSAQPAVITSEEYFKEAGIGWMGNNFKAQFLGLEVPATGEAELNVHKLEEGSVDGPIITELGGEEKAKISVSQFSAFLKDNRGSAEWFLFYLIGKDGKLWAVSARWLDSDRVWSVGARSVRYPDGCRAGRQVLSRK